MTLKISSTKSVPLTIYNRLYAKDRIDSKTVQFEVSALAKMPFDMLKLERLAGEALDAWFDGVTIIHKDDPYLIHLLEPKDGNTVHKLLDQLRGNDEEGWYKMLGITVPAETLNSHRVLVLGKGITATLEGVMLVASEILEEVLEKNGAVIHSIKIVDGSRTMEWQPAN